MLSTRINLTNTELHQCQGFYLHYIIWKRHLDHFNLSQKSVSHAVSNSFSTYVLSYEICFQKYLAEHTGTQTFWIFSPESGVNVSQMRFTRSPTQSKSLVLRQHLQLRTLSVCSLLISVQWTIISVGLKTKARTEVFGIYYIIAYGWDILVWRIQDIILQSVRYIHIRNFLFEKRKIQHRIFKQHVHAV